MHSADIELASDFSYSGLVFYRHDAAEHCRCFASDQNAKLSLMRVCFLPGTKCLNERCAVRLVMLEENRQNETAGTTEELLRRV